MEESSEELLKKISTLEDALHQLHVRTKMPGEQIEFEVLEPPTPESIAREDTLEAKIALLRVRWKAAALKEAGR